MLNFSNVQLQDVAVHRVGNKHRAERNFISENLLQVDEALVDALNTFFLKPLKRSEELYHFIHTSNVELNEIYSYAQTIFKDPSTLLSESKNILHHLYGQSNHPNIKAGEVYVAHFENLLIDDEVVDAIGIFKSERKNTFFKVSDGGESLVINMLDGINIEKLDKGCLIINTQEVDGFRIVTVDNNNYDALYWTHHFLAVDYVEDENFHTKLYMDMVTEFAQEVVAPKADKREQVAFMANTVDYFTNTETFDFEDFTEKVTAGNPVYKEELSSYREDFGLEETNGFEISESAFKNAKRKIKSVIKLDTDIQIKLDTNNPDASTQFIERGYDEEKRMSYYKVFFNEEM